MKTTLRRSGALVLLLLFTGSTFGLSLSKMTCNVSGIAQWTTDGYFDCCADDVPPFGADAFTHNCCDFTKAMYKVALLPPHKETTDIFQHSDKSRNGVFPRLFVASYPGFASPYHSDRSPPPLPVRHRWVFFCTFII